jgi:hypothetical protein
MRIRLAVTSIVLGVVLAGPCASSALSDTWAGPDPAASYPTGDVPFDCLADPTGGVCVNVGVSYLDEARAHLGLPPYVLPADFASLSAPQQLLILSDEDRITYGLPPITGLTDAASQDAAGGIAVDNDPEPSNPDWYAYTANWSGGYPNIVIAYEEWMYDDGPGGSNLDCTASTPDGCWDHRHDVLWVFDGSGALEMGVASGFDPSATPGYTQLTEQLEPTSPSPVYTYTWAEAVADGASASDVFPPPTVAPDPAASAPETPLSAHGASSTFTLKGVRVRGHRVSVLISAPAGADVRCSLRRAHRGERRVVRSVGCTGPVTFRHLPAGRYRLEVTSSAGTTLRRLVVR